jgi:anti-sigma factor RsiW
MTKGMHARAQQLIAQQRVEGLSESDRAWLDAHLQSCPACAQRANETDYALKSLRNAFIPVPSGLASRTQFRVRLRAQQLQEREPRRRMLWVICGMSWALGIASAPYVWQAFNWIGGHTGAPRLLLQVGFGLWWAIPALFAAAIVILESARQSNESDWSGQRK